MSQATRGRRQLPMAQVTNAQPRAMPRALLVQISEMMAMGLWKRGIMVALVISWNPGGIMICTR